MNQDFVQQLQRQAQKQAELTNNPLLPKQLDFFTSIIGRYSWQFILGLSFTSAVLLELPVWQYVWAVYFGGR